MTKFKIKICMREILTSYCFCPDLYRLKRYKQVEKTCKIKDEKKKKKKKNGAVVYLDSSLSVFNIIFMHS